MEFEVEKEEISAVRKCNSAQLVKRKNRVLKWKAFSEWRGESMAVQKRRRE
jgi:hypothetical protein